MNEANQAAAFEHAKEAYPRECCGLLVVCKGKEVYVPCANLGVGTDQFVIDPKDYARADAMGEIVAVVHSHPALPSTPSQADRVACEASGLPWFIVSYPNGQWAELKPQGYAAPLVGREWSHGVLDCYSLVRDWFAQERGVDLPDFNRFDEWWKRGENLYVDNFESSGFVRIDSKPLQVGDCFLMQVVSPVPNHAAVYLGDELILHHLQGRLSSRDVYGGYWQKITTHTLRHRILLT
jgi:proteasome lid subunit RPN8/RPN11